MNNETGKLFRDLGTSEGGGLRGWLTEIARHFEGVLGDADASLGEVEGSYLVREVIRGWRMLAYLVAVAILFSLLLLAVLPRIYTATVIVQPSTQSSSTISSSLASVGLKLGGVGENSVTPYARFLQTLDSYAVAEQLQRKYRILQKLYPER